MASLQYTIDVIKKYNLIKAISRDISLFLLTCLARGYTRETTKRFGFSYQAIAITGNQKTFTDYLNLQLLSQGMDNFLSKYASVTEIFDNLKSTFQEFKEKTDQAKAMSSTNPYQTIALIIDFTPRYFAILGFYNSYWRYLDTLQKEVSSIITDRVGTERNKFASLYPEIESIISSCAEAIGKKKNFQGALLTMMTLPEMATFLEGQKLSPALEIELQRRAEHYFYLYLEKDDAEQVLTSEEDIQNILLTCFPEENYKGITMLQGQSASVGKVRGEVFLLGSSSPPPSVYVLVAHSTHPKDIHFIEKSIAIVAEEGGILCHAAILARELQKPAVVGTKIATQVLKNGDMVEVDANTGTVKILPP